MSAKLFDLVGVKCNWCSRFLPAWRVLPLKGNQNICDYCLDWHIHASDVLGGAPPRGCQGCMTPWDVLQAITPGTAVRMYVVPKDGIQQMLCATCAAEYVSKRADHYENPEIFTQIVTET